MAKTRKSASPKKQGTESEIVLYYEEDNLFRKASGDFATKTSFPISGEGMIIPWLEDHNLQPLGTVTLYVNGPQGSQFSTTLTFEGQGGHSHSVGSHDARGVGTMTPASGTLSGAYPQNIPQTYRAGEICGRVRDDSVVGGQAFQEFYNIAIGGLVALSASTGVVLIGSTTAHASNHWGTPGLCAAIRNLGAAFQTQFNKPINVNDMSLVTGGMFDIQGGFSPPHQTHRNGRNVDMNWSSMSEVERTWFKAKAEEIGFVVEVHPNPNHWHLTYNG